MRSRLLGLAFVLAGVSSMASGQCTYLMNLSCPPSEDPQSFIHGLTVQVNGAVFPDSPGPCPEVTEILWNWGDAGSNPSWFPAQHAYGEPGIYTITTTAYVDTAVVAQASCDVEVAGLLASIPTLGGWGLGLFAVLMVILSLRFLPRRGAT
jgi:hypothetical protein